MFKRILVPVDGSDTANKALVTALQLARDSGGQIRLVHSLEELAYLWGYEYRGDTITLAREHATKVLDAAAGLPGPRARAVRSLAVSLSSDLAEQVSRIELPALRQSVSR